uniref:Uncharacterized protein n=1 Tax=Strongyloides venezuelensis TaxID=75913 RepID=A0A0K0FBJ4_STRVS
MISEYIETERWNTYKMSYENLSGSDMYTIVILLLFASIIIILMIRAIKPNDNIDEQVVMMLNLMRARVDIEHNYREKKKLREAKAKIQAWLSDIKQKGAGKLSFKCRSSTQLRCHEHLKNKKSPQSNQLLSSSMVYIPRQKSNSSFNNRQITISELYPCNSCYSFFVPEIIVTNENHNKESNSSICSLGDFNEDNDVLTDASSCPASRPLSSNSGEASISSEIL